MLVYYLVPFIVSNRCLLFWVSNGHNSVTVQNRTHVYMNIFDHKGLGNHLLQLCPKVVKHPVYTHIWLHADCIWITFATKYNCRETFFTQIGTSAKCWLDIYRWGAGLAVSGWIRDMGQNVLQSSFDNWANTWLRTESFTILFSNRNL